MNMKERNFLALGTALPLGLCLALGVIACGGSDSDGSNMGGSAGASSGGASSAGSSAMAGGPSKGGVSNTAGSTSAAGNSSGSPDDLDTGLPADKPISDLSDAEIAGLCRKFDEFYSSGSSAGMNLEDFTCRFSAVLAAALSGAGTDAALRVACKMTYDACVAAPAETTTKCGKPAGACTATVAELEACANDSAKAVEQLTSAFPSCAELTLADLMDLDGDGDAAPQNPTSCTTFEMKCPGGPTPPSSM